jgi:hypothetical protein
MHRRLRRNIAEGQHVFVFVDDVGGNFPADDPAEERIGHGSSPVPC